MSSDGNTPPAPVNEDNDVPNLEPVNRLYDEDSESRQDLAVVPVDVKLFKAEAHRQRWVEEGVLLREEMKRVLIFCRWMEAARVVAAGRFHAAAHPRTCHSLKRGAQDRDSEDSETMWPYLPVFHSAFHERGKHGSWRATTVVADEDEKVLLVLVANLQRDPVYIARMELEQMQQEPWGVPVRSRAEDVELYECQDKECLNGLHACAPCTCIAHQQRPDHGLWVYKSNGWNPTHLGVIGYVYQIGHDGLPCPNPAAETIEHEVWGLYSLRAVWKVRARECLCWKEEKAAILRAKKQARQDEEEETLRRYRLTQAEEEREAREERERILDATKARVLASSRGAGPPSSIRDRNVHYGDSLADDFIPHTGINVSNDGRRAVADQVNVRPQKRARLQPNALEDEFADWTPMHDDDESDIDTIADTMSTLDVTVDLTEDDVKRKRYTSSVCRSLSSGYTEAQISPG
ncbi:hypothetical protein DFH06DRAFT_1138518 [Mycena polygramma]|nr:hypothetical protein DFH06DRAFT_1138518 [Mycena polygramma]